MVLCCSGSNTYSKFSAWALLYIVPHRHVSTTDGSDTTESVKNMHVSMRSSTKYTP